DDFGCDLQPDPGARRRRGRSQACRYFDCHLCRGASRFRVARQTRNGASAWSVIMLAVHVEKTLGEFSMNVAFTSESRATALFGPSGPRKTNFIHIISCLLPPHP